MAQVPGEKAHLRPESLSPAPRTAITCASSSGNLRHGTCPPTLGAACRSTIGLFWCRSQALLAQVSGLVGAGIGIGSCWYRYRVLLAQVSVSGLVGVGIGPFGRRCGNRGVTCASRKHERPFYGAGPRQKTTPAPRTATTCAKDRHHPPMDRHHPHQGPPSPAPWTAVTCTMDRHHPHHGPPPPAPRTATTCAKDRHHVRLGLQMAAYMLRPRGAAARRGDASYVKE